MTKLGGTRHLKRLAAPPAFPIARKRPHGKYTVRPSPGPHSVEHSIPLALVLRDVLGYARSLREVRKILAQRLVYVDGRVIADYKFPVGIMDVLYIKNVEKYWRVLPHRRRLVLHEITPIEAKMKIVRIIGKRYVKNGWIQINLEDGRNILLKVDEEEERRKILDMYRTWDSLKITVPEQKILSCFRLEEGNYGLIIGGAHAGEHGTIVKISKQLLRKYHIASIETRTKELISTSLQYVLVVGKDRPEISLP